MDGLTRDEAAASRVRQAEEFLDPRKSKHCSASLVVPGFSDNQSVDSQMTKMPEATGPTSF